MCQLYDQRHKENQCAGFFLSRAFNKWLIFKLICHTFDSFWTSRTTCTVRGVQCMARGIFKSRVRHNVRFGRTLTLMFGRKAGRTWPNISISIKGSMVFWALNNSRMVGLTAISFGGKCSWWGALCHGRINFWGHYWIITPNCMHVVCTVCIACCMHARSAAQNHMRQTDWISCAFQKCAIISAAQRKRARSVLSYI